MALETYHTLRKSYLYDFLPVKADEDKPAENIPGGLGPRIHRALVEIRDVHAPPEFNPYNPWKIRKTLNHFEVNSGKITVHFNEAFDHVLRYWNLYMASHLTMWGRKVAVILWDFTDGRSPRKYDGSAVYFQMTPSEHCILGCEALIRDRMLKADDNIGLFWEPKQAFFGIKLFSRGGR